jgi:hypothetical protein
VECLLLPPTSHASSYHPASLNLVLRLYNLSQQHDSSDRHFTSSTVIAVVEDMLYHFRTIESSLRA